MDATEDRVERQLVELGAGPKVFCDKVFVPGVEWIQLAVIVGNVQWLRRGSPGGRRR